MSKFEKWAVKHPGKAFCLMFGGLMALGGGAFAVIDGNWQDQKAKCYVMGGTLKTWDRCYIIGKDSKVVDTEGRVLYEEKK